MRDACRVLELNEVRAHRRRARRAVSPLADLPAGGHPVHGLLDWDVDGFPDAFGEVVSTQRRGAR